MTTIRFAQPKDIIDMYRISCEAHLDSVYQAMIPPSRYKQFRDVYTPNSKRQQSFVDKKMAIMSDEYALVWVAEDDGVIAGYTMARLEQGVWALMSLFVAPGYQGRGIGRALFCVSYKAAPLNTPIEFKVITSNTRAIRMYKQEGFSEVGKADETFFGADQVIMQREPCIS